MSRLSDWELREILSSQGVHSSRENFERALRSFNVNGSVFGTGELEAINEAIQCARAPAP